ncbi:helix-turn-helix domain-containing protein [Sphingomonas sp. MMS24-J13]|uniref:helix-turn-helix domain-containing protein n=1 Tax=Sphingomonas sp. MMS24-J13 TaxID=3238686 RepID=UPI0038500C6E
MSDEVGNGNDPFGPRVGERLRAEREQQQITLEQVAERTRIPSRHLNAIEAGNYASLPAPTYSAGFVKTYARMLGLDGQKLSEEFRAEMGLASVPQYQPAPYEPADPRRTPPAGLALLALLIALVVGLGYLYWRGSSDQPAELAARGPVTPVAAPTTPAAPAPVVTPAQPAPAQGGPTVIGSTQDVWIKVSDGGKTLFMGTLKTGDHYTVPVDAVAPLLTTGRPGATTIMVGATPIPPVGDPDRLAKNVSLKTADLLARVATPAPAVQPPVGAPTPVENSAAGPE